MPKNIGGSRIGMTTAVTTPSTDTKVLPPVATGRPCCWTSYSANASAGIHRRRPGAWSRRSSPCSRPRRDEPPPPTHPRGHSAAVANRSRSDRKARVTRRGPDGYVPKRDGARVAAIRQLDLLVAQTRGRLFVESLQSPGPRDRTCATVPGLFERLSRRDHLLPIARENVDVESAGNDRLVLLGNHALFPHGHIRECRELVGDLLALASDGADVKLAVDPHAVVARDGRPQGGLYDYWFGIRLDRRTLDDPNHLGHARHERTVDAHDRHVSRCWRSTCAGIATAIARH